MKRPLHSLLNLLTIVPRTTLASSEDLQPSSRSPGCARESDRGSPWPARLGVCDQFCQWSSAGLALEICGKVMRLAETDFIHVSSTLSRDLLHD